MNAARAHASELQSETLGVCEAEVNSSMPDPLLLWFWLGIVITLGATIKAGCHTLACVQEHPIRISRVLALPGSVRVGWSSRGRPIAFVSRLGEPNQVWRLVPGI